MIELAPKGVSVHFARMVARGPVGTLANLQSRAASQLEHMDETVDSIASVEPDVIALAHTATGYVLGRDGDAKLAQRQEARTGTPFISALRGKAVLEEYGFEVVHAECLPDVKNIFEETPRRVYGLVKSANRPEADAVFISGVGLPTLSVLGAAEADLGKPVLSSACAMLWNALRVAGIGTPISGYGRLLQETKYRPASAHRPRKR
jgi:maleate cis-trans isomerase